MQKSETIGKLSKALGHVQATLSGAKKDSVNPHFKSKYAGLNSVWDACREPLKANGLSVIQGNSVGLDGTVIVETILAHDSGEWIQSELCLPLAKRDPQGVGSAITYGRRYGLAAIVGIVADEDDDGNAASHQPKPRFETLGAANSRPVIEQPKAPDDKVTKMRERINALCGELNAAGDTVKWSPTKLDEWCGENWETNYVGMNEAQLTSLGKDLKARLEAITKATGGK